MRHSTDAHAEQLLLLANELASVGTPPFAAMVVYRQDVVAKGLNGVVEASDPAAHAEVLVIREACKVLDRLDLAQCEILTSVEPSLMCTGALLWTRPDAVRFGAAREEVREFGFHDGTDPNIGRQLLRRAGVATSRIEDADFLHPFSVWKNHPARRTYADSV